MQVESQKFPKLVDLALQNPNLQTALNSLGTRVSRGRNIAVSKLPEFEQLRDEGQTIRDHTLKYLDLYLEKFTDAVQKSGGKVHWARNAGEAQHIIGSICKQHQVHKVAKGKSMVSEEIELNDYLQKLGITPIETDLGEYIIQLRGEKPSHLTAPAMHVLKAEVAATFDRHHGSRAPRTKIDGHELLTEAREELRKHFLTADLGITGANFCIAETGTIVIVTNEGNGDLTQSLPPVHIALTGIEKIVPTLEDACTLIRLLSRSATGQECSVYTTFSTGPKQNQDVDGPDEFHIVLLDNGRTDILDSQFKDILRCIRCGACQNSCPVYQQIGGHAYGSTYSGPMGAVLTPSLAGLSNTRHLPNASTLCGRCAEVCPVKIPIPDLLRSWREEEFSRLKTGAPKRWGLATWAFVARHPILYRKLINTFGRLLHWYGRDKKMIRKLNLPLLGNWTSYHNLLTPAKTSFISQYKKHRKANELES